MHRKNHRTVVVVPYSTRSTAPTSAVSNASTPASVFHIARSPRASYLHVQYRAGGPRQMYRETFLA